MSDGDVDMEITPRPKEYYLNKRGQLRVKSDEYSRIVIDDIQQHGLVENEKRKEYFTSLEVKLPVYREVLPLQTSFFTVLLVEEEGSRNSGDSIARARAYSQYYSEVEKVEEEHQQDEKILQQGEALLYLYYLEEYETYDIGGIYNDGPETVHILGLDWYLQDSIDQKFGKFFMWATKFSIDIVLTGLGLKALVPIVNISLDKLQQYNSDYYNEKIKPNLQKESVELTQEELNELGKYSVQVRLESAKQKIDMEKYTVNDGVKTMTLEEYIRLPGHLYDIIGLPTNE